MNDNYSIAGPKQRIHMLREQIVRRVEAERSIEAAYSTDVEDAARRFAQVQQELEQGYASSQTDFEKKSEAALKELRTHFQVEEADARREYEETLAAIEERHAAAVASAERRHRDACWMVTSYFDESHEDSPQHRLDRFREQLDRNKQTLREEWDELQGLLSQATTTLERRRMWSDFPGPEPSAVPDSPDALRQRFSEMVALSELQLTRIRRQVLPRLFVGLRPLWMFLLVTLAFILPSLWGMAAIRDGQLPVVNFDIVRTDELAIAAGIAGSVAVVVCMTLYLIASRRSTAIWMTMQQCVADAAAVRRRWLDLAKKELQKRRHEAEEWQATIGQRRDAALKQAEASFAEELDALTLKKQTELQQANDVYPPKIDGVVQRRQQAFHQHARDRNRKRAEMAARHEAEQQRLNDDYERTRADRQRERERQWMELIQQWRTAWAEFEAAIVEFQGRAESLRRPWTELSNADWSPPADLPPAIPAGFLQLDFHPLPFAGCAKAAQEPDHEVHGPPERDVQPPIDLNDLPPAVASQLREPQAAGPLELPVLLPFPQSPSLLIKTDGAGRAETIAALQTAMLRVLTLLPPGKVRFTILDPVGLGESFATFMHLADFDEQLISYRIWTEASQIDQRLTDLTEHMENIFQTYLRNEFQTIEEYNTTAGEVAEPYHVLVAADFPVNFSENAARRLVSIASSGPRCGVFTLLGVDVRQRLPLNFHLEDLAAQATVIQHLGNRFVLGDPELSDIPLSFDVPPPADAYRSIVRNAGRASKDARRVEVAFERIAPAPDSLWAASAQKGIDVPLGRAGAIRLQHLKLGRGTSQHVLIAGKTGSGKSSFLHALITNVALHYSPNEVQLFLVDFKKGVEFKTYATHGLPHVRVLAIESDREFGVSVLEELDRMLKDRGDRFRRAGVQDLAAYRTACPDEIVPRVLLVVDEFQEFFVEDDRLAQSAALLLDRLVRQGRAFGVHVLLGSQTLGGAYSLARSTLGQMAVRVALQCSESDAHLILSEENTAARLLTRPGEAIYNDANGLVEGNHPFQIAWLPDQERDRYLKRIAHRTQQSGEHWPAPIVFEGHIAADPQKNAALVRLLDARQWPKPSPAPVAWLGEAVAIRDEAAHIAFRRQSGWNLLVVGQNPDGAFGILSTCVISLAAQLKPRAAEGESRCPQFLVLDGTGGNWAHGPTWGRLADGLPHSIQVHRPADAASVLSMLTAEIARREELPPDELKPTFVLIDNLGAFRSLRKDDDDFGFAGFDKDKPASLGRQFADLLKNGPALGVHTLMWSDTANNVNRWLSPQSLRELEMRIVFPMSATDSSHLIDSPAAGRLGPNRALLSLEDQGTLEKFRPYGPPSSEWLNRVRQGLANRDGHVEICDDISAWTVS